MLGTLNCWCADMRSLLTIALVILALWAMDAYIFDGYYGGSLELRAQDEGRTFYRQVQNWANRNLGTR
jgi:hypothetical protein